MLLPIAYPIRTPRLFFKDLNGKPLVGGKIFSYNSEVEADTFKPTYRDAFRNALNKNPIVLDNAGSAFIYIFTATRLEVFDKNGNWIERRYLPQTEYYAYFYDQYGYPLKNGKVWTYDIQSTIKKPSYQDAEQTLPNTNPIILDENGGAAICIAGAYRLRIYNSKNVFITDQDFKQENRFVLTSKVYPLYFVESVATDFDLEKATVFNVPVMNDSVSAKFSMLGATIRNPLNSYSNIDSVQPSFSLIGAQITEDKTNVYKKYTPLPEAVRPSFAIKSAQITEDNNYIVYTMKIDAVQPSFSIKGAQRTN